jgi:hypothetical protein
VVDLFLQLRSELDLSLSKDFLFSFDEALSRDKLMQRVFVGLCCVPLQIFLENVTPAV